MFTNYLSRPYDFNLAFNGLTFWTLTPIEGGMSLLLSDHEAELCVASWQALVLQETCGVSPEQAN